MRILNIFCEAIIEKFNNLRSALADSDTKPCQTKGGARARRGFALNAGINSEKL